SICSAESGIVPPFFPKSWGVPLSVSPSPPGRPEVRSIAESLESSDELVRPTVPPLAELLVVAPVVVVVSPSPGVAPSPQLTTLTKDTLATAKKPTQCVFILVLELCSSCRFARRSRCLLRVAACDRVTREAVPRALHLVQEIVQKTTLPPIWYRFHASLPH